MSDVRVNRHATTRVSTTRWFTAVALVNFLEILYLTGQVLLVPLRLAADRRQAGRHTQRRVPGLPELVLHYAVGFGRWTAEDDSALSNAARLRIILGVVLGTALAVALWPNLAL